MLPEDCYSSMIVAVAAAAVAGHLDLKHFASFVRGNNYEHFDRYDGNNPLTCGMQLNCILVAGNSMYLLQYFRIGCCSYSC